MSNRNLIYEKIKTKAGFKDGSLVVNVGFIKLSLTEEDNHLAAEDSYEDEVSIVIITVNGMSAKKTIHSTGSGGPQLLGDKVMNEVKENILRENPEMKIFILGVGQTPVVNHGGSMEHCESVYARLVASFLIIRRNCQAVLREIYEINLMRQQGKAQQQKKTLQQMRKIRVVCNNIKALAQKMFFLSIIAVFALLLTLISHLMTSWLIKIYWREWKKHVQKKGNSQDKQVRRLGGKAPKKKMRPQGRYVHVY